MKPLSYRLSKGASDGKAEVTPPPAGRCARPLMDLCFRGPRRHGGPSVTRAGIYVDCFGALKVRGRVLAVSGVPASHRRFTAVDSSGALAQVAGVPGWRGSVFDLLLENVRSPALLASRSRSLETLSVRLAERGYTATSRCSQG